MSRFYLRVRGRSLTGMIEAVSAKNADGLQHIVENLVASFVGFVPLGTVQVAGVAERAAAGSGSCSTAVLSGAARKSPAAIGICTLLILWMGRVQSTGVWAAIGRQR